MDNELLEKIDVINNDLNNSIEAKEILKLKEIIMNDKELLNDLDKLKKMDINDKEYINLKMKLFDNSNYKRFKELENKMYYFSLEASNKLKELRGINEDN